MCVTINWKPKALKQLRKLPNLVQIEIVKAVTALDDSFECNPKVTMLINHIYGYRLRVGNYRVLFDSLELKTILLIEEIKKRDERTY